MPKTPEASPLTQAREVIRRKEEAALGYYEGNCPNPECENPSLKTVMRTPDENIGPGPIFVACGNCGWAETGINWQERTGEKLF